MSNWRNTRGGFLGCGRNTRNKAEVLFLFMLESLVELELVLERLENYESVVP